jgi:hypothetical protein
MQVVDARTLESFDYYLLLMSALLPLMSHVRDVYRQLDACSQPQAVLPAAEKRAVHH